MYTPYSTTNAKFSNDCHELAQEFIYPKLFGVDRSGLEFFDSDEKIATFLDVEMAIDRRVRVDNGFAKPFEFHIQERFRRPIAAHWRDITITKWNHNSNLPSELFKIKSGVFVYGYGNDPLHPTDFIEVVVCDTSKVLTGISNGKLKYGTKPNPRSNQSFIYIKFDALKKYHAIDHHYRPGQMSFLDMLGE